MLSRLKKMLVRSQRAQSTLAEKRLAAMIGALGEPIHVDRDEDARWAVDIYAFGRDFVEECKVGNDEGFVLVTSGMSDRLMDRPEGSDPEESQAIELMWYVRDLNPEFVVNLRWLARLPWTDQAWFAMGQTVSLPQPAVSFCPFGTFLLLPPIIRTDRYLFLGLEQQGHPLGTLVVHLISAEERAFIHADGGLDRFLDLLDEADYPTIFSPTRRSIVR